MMLYWFAIRGEEKIHTYGTLVEQTGSGHIKQTYLVLRIKECSK